MFFDKIRLVGRSNVDLQKQDVDPTASYYLKDVIGLGPPDIDVTILQSLYQGGLYQNSRPQGREVGISIGFNPDHSSGQTVSDLREALYGLITPGAQGPAQIQLMNGPDVVVQTDCYVKHFEPAVTTKDPDVQITFACLSTYLSAPANVHPDLGSLDKSNPVIFNPGNAPTGFHLEITFTDALSEIEFVSSLDSSYKMRIQGDFTNNQKLTIDTRPGLRKIECLHIDTTVVNLVDTLTSGSDWLMLDGGNNSFITDWQDFDWTELYFTPQFWGI